MRYAIRRTQRQVEESRRVSKAPKSVETLERADLQALAKERGIDARQSTEELREQLK